VEIQEEEGVRCLSCAKENRWVVEACLGEEVGRSAFLRLTGNLQVAGAYREVEEEGRLS
jgi:hypothetical protein